MTNTRAAKTGKSAAAKVSARAGRDVMERKETASPAIVRMKVADANRAGKMTGGENSTAREQIFGAVNHANVTSRRHHCPKSMSLLPQMKTASNPSRAKSK